MEGKNRMDVSASNKNRNDRRKGSMIIRELLGCSYTKPMPPTYSREELHELIKKHFPHYLEADKGANVK
jgi:thioredoxin-related protein